MGCTVREKHMRTNRRYRSMKSNVDHSNSLAKSVHESGLKPLNYHTGFHESLHNNNPNNINSICQYPIADDCGWGYYTEEQLEEIFLKNLDHLYLEAISKLVALGFDGEDSLKAVLHNGHCYGVMDALTNIMNNSLAYLNSGCCENTGNSEESELVFTDLRQLEEYSLMGMVCLLQEVRPHLSKADAMWCLLMSDLHVGLASTIGIPMLPSPSGGYGIAVNNVGSLHNNMGSSGVVDHALGLCKFHEGCGFANEDHSELPVNGFSGAFSNASEATSHWEIDCPNRFNHSPSMKSLTTRNVSAFDAGFSSNTKLQAQTQGCASSTLSVDSSRGTVQAADGQFDQDVESSDGPTNSVVNKFRDLNIGDNLESLTEEQKDEILRSMMHQVRDLERQVKEQKEWAHQKAIQAARKLSNDLAELNILKMEKEEVQGLKEGKQTLEDAAIKSLSEIENALRNASSQVDQANAAVRQLEIENAEIRAEIEASKLSASESARSCLEAEKREKKCIKRLLAWDKQKRKLQEEIAAENQKIFDLQQQLVCTNSAQKEAEAKWRQEVKAKELALAEVEEEMRGKAAVEASNKRNLEALRLKIEIDMQCRKDDIQRLEHDLLRLKATAESTRKDSPPNALPTRNSEVSKPQGRTTAIPLCEVDEPANSAEQEVSPNRECLVCMKAQVSVVFLPCAHQVTCISCSDSYGKRGKASCPYCQAQIEQKIRVFGASS
ncbi:hypothetical protein Nepgr_028595 [Nepenthes gracilis]|uniref:RING-type domain-containing protein n=1 Tax=Nepenthes gracilis TaxID=150966 RepID=A0AAD3TCC1_NEPGR|nr:hypothetical protein Nepgr_028595 [Nepenthes gracilis]